MKANSICFDCKDEEKEIKAVSLNNGVFLCEDCSEIHKQADKAISLIRPIDADFWNQYQINKLTFGGNEKLQSYLVYYQLQECTDFKKRYHSVALQYYRSKLQAFSSNQSFSESQPEPREGKRLIE